MLILLRTSPDLLGERTRIHENVKRWDRPLAAPVLLGSLWALLPAGAYVIVVAYRSSLEDRTLRDELDGYQATMQDVRYRLIPGIW